MKELKEEEVEVKSYNECSYTMHIDAMYCPSQTHLHDELAQKHFIAHLYLTPSPTPAREVSIDHKRGNRRAMTVTTCPRETVSRISIAVVPSESRKRSICISIYQSFLLGARP